MEAVPEERKEEEGGRGKGVFIAMASSSSSHGPIPPKAADVVGSRARAPLHTKPTGEGKGGEADVVDFWWTSTPTPHTRRRQAILERHPEVRELMKPDIWQAPYIATVVVLNLVVAWKVGQADPSLLSLLFVTYVTSATFNQICFISMHETMHDTIFSARWPHYVLGLLTNVSMGVPACSGFFYYHLPHHTLGGVVGGDPDIATAFEGKLVGRSMARKILYVLCIPLTYTLRPVFTDPKPLQVFDVVNFLVILISDCLVVRFWGLKSLLYLVGGSVLGAAAHPFTGHFIAEHYVLQEAKDKIQDTYSCYDICNPMMLNVGYHVEHHDFPNIPGTKLPKLKEMASEYYDNLPYYTSWIRCTWSFITTEHCTPISRVQRFLQQGGQVKEPHKCFHGQDKCPESPFYPLQMRCERCSNSLFPSKNERELLISLQQEKE